MRCKQCLTCGNGDTNKYDVYCMILYPVPCVRNGECDKYIEKNKDYGRNTIMVYELRRIGAEIKISDRNRIRPGIAYDISVENGNVESELIQTFEDPDEAKEALRQYKSLVSLLSNLYKVEEYYIEENEYDEDGDWIAGGDILSFSEMPCYEIKYNYLMENEKHYTIFNLDDAKAEADSCISYTQQDVVIYKNGKKESVRRWWGTEPTDEDRQEDIIELGGGFYSEWFDV